MIVRSIRCGNCDSMLPTGPGLFGIRLAPYTLTCKKCGAKMKTGMSLRMTWLSWLVWKVAFLVIAIGWTAIVLLEKWPLGQTLITILVGAVMFGLFGGFIVSIILPLFLQPIIDIIHAIIWPRSEEEPSADIDQ